ncbi:MAG: sulfite exporter TauE/SafE family protein [Acidimicrobiia bacterium]|nr:sulfite exporter TauE/SafE family protein [Acidimicrobiia bacterium]
MDLVQWIAAFGAAFAAGMVNSVAGGGTLLTFPSLVWLGQSPVVANATSTAALWPGSLGGMWGYRSELKKTKAPFFFLILPSVVGGIAGAVLLRRTPPGVFAKFVPFLILFATILFMLQASVQRWLRVHQHPHDGARWLAGAATFQFGVAVYGGYFGAGIGILMLAALSLLGLTDIHQMNGLKNLFALCINVVATAYFLAAGLVNWPVAATMALGAVAGGYGGAGLARKVGPAIVRRTVIAIGFFMTVSLFFRLY